ncbi:MAG: hypothetical protein JWN32_1877 [Solirubrobacterales bacterium]|jgi:hypothetical protein|nr:hypothetical protein [Solirubrobacterales bacterium]
MSSRTCSATGTAAVAAGLPGPRHGEHRIEPANGSGL